MTSVREAKSTRAKATGRVRTRAATKAPLDRAASQAGTSPPFAPLATERLVLRALVPEDAESLHRLVNDWEVTRNLAVVPFPYPRQLAGDWIASTRRSMDFGSSPDGAVGPGWLRSAWVIRGSGNAKARSLPVFASLSITGPPG